MTSPHLSTLMLHRLRYGELSDAELAEARTHLDVCGHCAARLEAQHKERAAFVVQPIPAAIRDAARARPSLWTRAWPMLPVLAMAALAMLWLRPAAGPTDDVLLKGALDQVEVWVDVGEGPRLHEPGQALGGGDRLQLKYRPDGAEHAAVAGRDGTGTIEFYGTFATPGGDGLVDTPFGLTLDDSPGTQELYVVLGDTALESATVVEAVDRYPVPTPGLQVLRVDVRKESPTP